MTKIFQITGNL